MNCPSCHSSTTVIDSRAKPDTVYRRRRCDSCDFRFTTWELSEQAIARAARVLEEGSKAIREMMPS